MLFDKTLRLFSIDGKTNRKVQSVFVRDFPIHHAEFAPTSDEIILSSRRSFFYVYDLQAAKVSRHGAPPVVPLKACLLPMPFC